MHQSWSTLKAVWLMLCCFGNLKGDLLLHQSSANLVENCFQMFVWAREQHVQNLTGRKAGNCHSEENTNNLKRTAEVWTATAEEQQSQKSWKMSLNCNLYTSHYKLLKGKWVECWIYKVVKEFMVCRKIWTKKKSRKDLIRERDLPMAPWGLVFCRCNSDGSNPETRY